MQRWPAVLRNFFSVAVPLRTGNHNALYKSMDRFKTIPRVWGNDRSVVLKEITLEVILYQKFHWKTGDLPVLKEEVGLTDVCGDGMHVCI